MIDGNSSGRSAKGRSGLCLSILSALVFAARRPSSAEPCISSMPVVPVLGLIVRARRLLESSGREISDGGRVHLNSDPSFYFFATPCKLYTDNYTDNEPYPNYWNCKLENSGDSLRVTPCFGTLRNGSKEESHLSISWT